MKKLLMLFFVLSLFLLIGCDTKKKEQIDSSNINNADKCRETEQQKIRITKSIKEAEELVEQAEKGSDAQLNLILLIEEAKEELFKIKEELKDCNTSLL
ncbi:hypothetical protein PGH07_09960 [Sulfurovum sp. zt1-1]|uniref:Lipoprotein n=1 Tax=Sulfurovum zhangzhouensis TaxID=3019067 RepID=A0ABT7R0A1_9BACT|nr:hypothetical protein [Sulfurovum zhangzhouensis]MDM5272503.1 hypothetical protein [Sulfurovum zhangzhouensis]